MKKLLFTFTISICCLAIVHAQKRDAIWMLAYNTINIGIKTGIDFSVLPADTFSDFRKPGFLFTDASICDTSGNLLFYTNGIFVANILNDTLLNSKDFNPGFSSDYYWYEGMGFSQAAIVLPRPNYSNKYFIFHVSGEEFNAYGSYQIQPLHLSLSEVDMNLDNGLGGIPADKKNLHIIEDTITQGRITACKHGNGRDWWVIMHKFHSDLYYKVLVEPDTNLVTTQTIGPVETSNDILGMAKFSPDGSKYCFLNFERSFDLLDFDRCSGEFSNPLTITVPDSSTDIPWTLGCEFSSSGRFLYINSYKHVYQYDLWSQNIDSSVIEVSEWDTSYLPTATWFFLPQRAPDGKIYISTYNGTLYLHVIDQPDSLGLSCNVMQHSFKLTQYSTPIPNFPNYQLGKLEGSDCDTVFTSSPHSSLENHSYSIYPNPVSNWLNIDYSSKEDALFELFDIDDHRVSAISLFHYFKNRLLDVSALPAGVYLAAVSQKGKRVWSEKVVVGH